MPRYNLLVQKGQVEETTGVRTLGSSQIASIFGPKGPIAQRIISALCKSIAVSSDQAALLKTWRREYPLPEKSKQKLSEGDSLGIKYPLPQEQVTSEMALFAIHTYFALVAKLLAAQAVVSAGNPPLARCPSSASGVLDLMRRIESGESFRNAGILNFPQDDCFNWYLTAWSDALADSIGEALDCSTSCGIPSAGEWDAEFHELLGELYASLLPRKVRHALGEYYTPEWLVDFLLDTEI